MPKHDGQHHNGGNGPLSRRQAFPGLSAEEGDIEKVADEEGHDASHEEPEAVRHQQDVARAAEELRRDEEADRPEVGHVPTQQVGERRGGEQRQEGRFHRIVQVRSQDASEEIQDARDQKKGARNAPNGVFTHRNSSLSTAS